MNLTLLTMVLSLLPLRNVQSEKKRVNRRNSRVFWGFSFLRCFYSAGQKELKTLWPQFVNRD